MQPTTTTRISIIVFLFLFISLMFPYLPGHEADNNLWTSWSQYLLEHGLKNAYGSGTDYLPFYQWIMWLFAKLSGSTDVIAERIGYLRCFTLAFDFLGIWFLWKWLDRKTDFLLLLLFCMLNISYSYNTVIWGQVDGIMTTMVFAAIYYAQKKKIVVSGLWMVLALNMKLQAIIFLPVWGILCLQAVLQERKIKMVVFTLASMILLQFLLLLPFILVPGGLAKVGEVVTTSMGRYPVLSMNAFNWWYWISPNAGAIEDNGSFIGTLSYRNTGLLLFFVLSLLSLLPLLLSMRKNAKDRNSVMDKDLVALSCALIVLLFFFFNTQMHERYCHPAYLFLAAYAFHTKRFIFFWLFAISYFLNMEGVLQFMKLPNYHTLIFDPCFVAGLFGLQILLLGRRPWIDPS